MKLFRFMSFIEFEKYCAREKLVNMTNHNKDNGKATNSIGFCFFDYDQYKPEEMLHSIFGVANVNICCVFETKCKYLKKSNGRYSQPVSKNKLRNRRIIIADEYCITTYSQDNFKLLQFAIPEYSNWDKWKWIRA